MHRPLDDRLVALFDAVFDLPAGVEVLHGLRGYIPRVSSITVITLGTHRLVNPTDGDPPFLSAASGTAWSGERLYTVGDDQSALVEFDLGEDAVLEALRRDEDTDILEPGVAQRIIQDVLPDDEDARKEEKPDFEALTLITEHDLAEIAADDGRDELLRRFPHGVVIMAGSGGTSWEGNRRSRCVVYLRDEHGHIVGLPAQVSLEELHEYLEGSPWLTGELNIEGLAVHGRHLVLAQRGNSTAEDGSPAKSMLIHLSLAEVLRSFSTDLKVGRMEIEQLREYDLGSLPLEVEGERYEIKLDFTDLDAVTGDRERRMVFTAAAEGHDQQGPAKGEIAGSVVGVISADGDVLATCPLEDTSIKLEGIDGRYNAATGTIDLLLVSDADDPDVPAPLMAARLPA